MVVETRTLNDGAVIPAIGFGTYPLAGEEGIAAMVSAFETGYRLIDTAVNYENESEVGEAIRRCGIPREEIVVQTKLPGRHHAHDLAVASVQGSLERLRLDWVDVVLIHWPNPKVGLYREAWQALVELRQQGLVRSIGVSNFTEDHLAAIIEDSGVTPAINQVELYPYFPQDALRAEHARLGILTEAWSPMGKRNPPFEEPCVVAAAQAHGVTPAQVVLRWHVQIGSVPMPKSEKPARQRENLDVFGFELSESEMAAIAGIGQDDGGRDDRDPDTHEEM